MRSGRAPRCCRGSLPAGTADGVSPCTTRARTRALAITAPAKLVSGRGVTHLSVGGVQIDQAVQTAFLSAIAPAGIEASLVAAQSLEDDRDAALAQWRKEVERHRFQASRAERRYLAVDPDNRLVARGLEAEWERALLALRDAEAELVRREAARPKVLGPEEIAAISRLLLDVGRVWSAPSTTDKDRKELLRTLVEEVVVEVEREEHRAALVLRWRGGATTELVVELPRAYSPPIRTDEDTVDSHAQARRPLRRRHDRGHLEPPGTAHRNGRALHPRSRLQPAHLVEDRPSRLVPRREERRARDDHRGGKDPRRRAVHGAPLAWGRLHRR